MEGLVVLKKQDLEEMLQEAAQKAIEAMKPDRKEALNVDEALSYLKQKGIDMPKSAIYKFTMTGSIPFRRFGERKLMFVTDELDSWVSDRMSGRPLIEKAVIKSAAKSARRKLA